MTLAKNLENLEGARFGRWTVITWVPSNRGGRHWLCECKCGGRGIVSVYRLKSGHSRSCGCLRREPYALKHGDKGNRLYSIWTNMKKRCHNPRAANFNNYGGRGIIVCHQWREDYTAFRSWALSSGYEDGLSIDRIDNDKGYSPDNCRWVSRLTQQRNRRTSRWLEIDGRKLALQEASKIYGVPYRTIYFRLSRGVAPSAAVQEECDFNEASNFDRCGHNVPIVRH